MEEGGMREDDLELEAIIKELEDEIEEDEHELEESNDASSGIGGSDNKQPAPAANADSTDDPEGTGVDVVAESEDGMEGESETLDNLHEEEGDELEEGEDIDLEEVIKSLREEEEELDESEDGMEVNQKRLTTLLKSLKNLTQ
jgi:nucleophosmin 1